MTGLFVAGIRLCKKCLRKSGATPDAALNVLPGIFGWNGQMRHLLQEDGVTTLCGYDTQNENWVEPWGQH